jgi:hypothetical protein
MLRSCSSPGCNTLTLGELCLEHELAAKVAFVAVKSPPPPSPGAPPVRTSHVRNRQ